MTLLASFQVLLARYSQQEQIVVGTPIAGRTRIETEPLIGFFVNTLALRGDLSGHPSFEELLQRTREAALGAYVHQELPFEKLVEELQPARSLSYAPLFQVMFALQSAPHADIHWGTAKLRPLKLASQSAKFDLSLDVYETAEGLEAWLEYDRDLFTPETATRMLQEWQTLLVGVIQMPTQPIHELPLAILPEQPFPRREWKSQTVTAPSSWLSAGRSEMVAPRTTTEEAVANIWAGLLKLEYVGIYDNFFDLGGHSLLATRVIARLQNTFPIKLFVRNIFEAPTVAGLAEVIDAMLAEESIQDDELAALLAELENLSEEEAQRLIAEV